MQLVLASSSPYRRALIERLGLPCLAVSPPFEEGLPGRIKDPTRLVAHNAYKSEGLGIALFEYLRGDDPTAVIGLPLITLCDLLSRFGVQVLLEGAP